MTNDTANQIKRCLSCRRQLPLDQFYKIKRGMQGVQGRCKSCVLKRLREKTVERRNSQPPTKLCTKCLIEKPLDAFFTYNSGAIAGWCKVCRRERARLRSADYRREQKYKLTYGITVEDYEEMLKQQNYSCKICGATEPGGFGGKYFAVDHDHTSGEVRGLLCQKCNQGIGLFKEDVQILLKAISYLTGQNNEQ